MGTTLIVKGTLRGMGSEVECSLIATRSESMSGSSATFTKCALLDAPIWLPDGYYEATFCGQSAFLHRMNGVWSVGVPWRQTARGQATEDDADAVLMHPSTYSQRSIYK